MRQVKRAAALLVAALVLGGCGADWFPEKKTEGSVSANQATIASTEVGILVASVKNGPGSYTVSTTKGVFSTYSSLVVPVQTTVYLDRYTDPGTKLLIGKVLRALEARVLVKEILGLVE